MAIQGTQVLVYTNIHCFCIFLIFPFFLLKKKNQTNKQSIKIRLTQTTPQIMQEIRKEEKSLRIFSFQTGDLDGDPYFCMNFCPNG